MIVRDRPQDLGFAPIESEDEDDDTPSKSEALASPEAEPEKEIESSWKRYRRVLTHRQFLIASVAIGFQSMARYGLLIWVPVHFLGEDGRIPTRNGSASRCPLEWRSER